MEETGQFTQFANILCISLRHSHERREHIKKELERVRVPGFQFVEAYDKSSNEVKRVFCSDFVAKYPPCFRCGKDQCQCKNKSLILSQIGNWLSHIAAWRSILSNDQGLTLICEDDVKFREGIHGALELVAKSEEINTPLENGNPVLVRLGWGLCEDHRIDAPPMLTRHVKMANPCYAINSAMASLLLHSLHEINTTSDIYVHQIIGSASNHFTVMPPPAYELSWSTGELHSEIRPKQKRVEHLQRLLDSMDQDDPGYRATQTLHRNELRRLEQFEKYNESPTLHYSDEFDLI